MALCGLEGLPRAAFSTLPTPLEDADDLGSALGLARPLLIKRDDLNGPGLGGNKVRKLEYLLADARRQHADSLVTTGAGQSNHARLTAILGRAAGLDVHLVLPGDPDELEGNLLLGHLAGATIHSAGSSDWTILDEARHDVTYGLARQGHRPYSVPMGGSTSTGALGYARCYRELLSQLDEARIEKACLVHASSTGGTQSGLLVGRLLAGRGPRVIGVDVAKGGIELSRRVAEISAGTAKVLEPSSAVDSELIDLVELFDFAGAAYGEVSPEAARALKVGLRTRGLVTDPVYSAKAMAALPELQGKGAFGDTEAVVFLHTGGQPALFAKKYAQDVAVHGVADEDTRPGRLDRRHRHTDESRLLG